MTVTRQESEEAPSGGSGEPGSPKAHSDDLLKCPLAAFGRCQGVKAKLGLEGDEGERDLDGDWRSRWSRWIRPAVSQQAGKHAQTSLSDEREMSDEFQVGSHETTWITKSLRRTR